MEKNVKGAGLTVFFLNFVHDCTNTKSKHRLRYTMKTLANRYDKKRIAQLPKVLFQGRIVVVQGEEEARKAVKYLLSQKVIGLDTETKPIFKKGAGMNPVALLQISTRDTCFLFRLNHIGFTPELVSLLSDDNVLKVGLSLKDDFTQLRRRRPFTPGKYVELQSMAKDMGIVDQSLQKLYANIFEQRISKSQQLSNWEADILTEAQKRYAATDAWACIQLYEEFLRLKEVGYMLEIVPEPEPPAQPAVVLSPEQVEKRNERKQKKEQEKRRRKKNREKERRRRNVSRANKETLKNIQ